MCVQKWVVGNKKCHKKNEFVYTFICHVARRRGFGSIDVFAIITELKGLSEWFHSSPWIMGQGSQNCTQPPHFCSALFREIIRQEPLENGKETSLFLLDWEECGTALMVFAGLARPKPDCRFSSEAGMWVSELISANKACSGPYYSTTTENLDWNNSALVQSGHVLNTDFQTNLCLFKMNGLDSSSCCVLLLNDIG